MAETMLMIYAATVVVSLLVFVLLEKYYQGAVYLDRLITFVIVSLIPVVNLLGAVAGIAICVANLIVNGIDWSRLNKRIW